MSGNPQQHGACGSGKSEVTKEEYDEFYQQRFGEMANIGQSPCPPRAR